MLQSSFSLLHVQPNNRSHALLAQWSYSRMPSDSTTGDDIRWNTATDGKKRAAEYYKKWQIGRLAGLRFNVLTVKFLRIRLFRGSNACFWGLVVTDISSEHSAFKTPGSSHPITQHYFTATLVFKCDTVTSYNWYTGQTVLIATFILLVLNNTGSIVTT